VEVDDILRSIAEEHDFISSKKLFEGLGHRSDVVCVKRDFLFRSGTFDGEYSKAVMRRSSRQLGTVLVTGHSSYPFRSEFVPLLRARGFSHFYALNATPSRYVTPLPLGLTSELSITSDHLVLGNPNMLLEAWKSEPERPDFDGSIYINVSTGTASKIRRELQDVLRDLPGVTQALPDKSPNGRVGYLRAIRRANFTPAPRGVGSDTHRLWETLYMGGIPVILPDPRIDPLVEHLPVLVVESWSALRDRGFLLDSWQRIAESEKQLDLLRASTWVRTITQTADSLRQI
jgi:hypothetical protein